LERLIPVKTNAYEHVEAFEVSMVFFTDSAGRINRQAVLQRFLSVFVRPGLDFVNR